MLDANPPLSPPGALNKLLEFRAPFELASVMLYAPQLALAPKGDQRPVMLLPGYMADEASMRPLARYLKYLGYNARGWGFGRNLGQVERFVHGLGPRVDELSEELGGAKITLIGWSLGGVIAREVARLFAESVREVITLGTPIVGGPKYTAAGKRFAKKEGLDLDRFELEVHARNSIGIKQPVTSIYSKTDGIVAWRASVDTYNKQARNIEVSSSHFGLGVNPRVWRIIAHTLAGQHK